MRPGCCCGWSAKGPAAGAPKRGDAAWLVPNRDGADAAAGAGVPNSDDVVDAPNMEGAVDAPNMEGVEAAVPNKEGAGVAPKSEGVEAPKRDGAVDAAPNNDGADDPEAGAGEAPKENMRELIKFVIQTSEREMRGDPM